MTEEEKRELVLMLCAPSSLNIAWARPGNPNIKDELVNDALNKVKVSDEAKNEARELMKKARESGKRQHFAAVAELFRDGFWSGVEPHPE
jgi:hypothetical protein